MGIGEIFIIILCYYLSGLFIPGEKNTYIEVFQRFSVMKENLFKNYWSRYTILFILVGSMVYGIILIYLITMNKLKMPGREYGTSYLISPKNLNRALADMNMGESEPENILVIKKKISCLHKVVEKFRHRKDD